MIDSHSLIDPLHTGAGMSLSELVKHYTQNELPRKAHSKQEVYGSYLKSWIVPKWGTLNLSGVKAVAVETWLGVLPLENSSRAKIRNIMSALYSHAIRWELTNRNPITMVRQTAKRAKHPDVLTTQEVTALLRELPEPSRTAVFVTWQPDSESANCWRSTPRRPQNDHQSRRRDWKHMETGSILLFNRRLPHKELAAPALGLVLGLARGYCLPLHV